MPEQRENSMAVHECILAPVAQHPARHSGGNPDKVYRSGGSARGVSGFPIDSRDVPRPIVARKG